MARSSATARDDAFRLAGKLLNITADEFCPSQQWDIDEYLSDLVIALNRANPGMPATDSIGAWKFVAGVESGKFKNAA